MKKIYVFLTNMLGGVTGAPSYVRNKKKWLEKEGWTVLAFDGESKFEKSVKIEFEELKSFEDNRIEELIFSPFWLNQSRRNKVLASIIDKIGEKYEQVVIESNGLYLSEWGELIAKRVKAKHIIYLLGENVIIQDNNMFNFLYYKYKANELFSISKEASKLLMSQYWKQTDADIRYWNAMSRTETADVEIPDVDKLAKADFTICHFGRLKGYFDYMVNQIVIFANNNLGKKMNIVFFGLKDIPSSLQTSLLRCKNLNLYFFDSQFPIPKHLFRISDVIIATAGCAYIANEEGVKTISMNVASNKPLGILGYTTNQGIYSSTEYPDSVKPLSVLLKDILIDLKYDQKEPECSLEKRDHGYEYQMACVNLEKSLYFNFCQESRLLFNRDLLRKLLLKMGLIKILRKLMYLHIYLKRK